MRILGNLLIIFSLAILGFIFAPIAKEEIKYTLDQTAHVKYVITTEQLNTFEKPLTPPNTDFSILIPKIGAVAPVISGVDSQNKTEYLKALKTGVAHAKGTAYPGDAGNVYIFAHSTDAFYNIGRYNAVFYLLGKLKANDDISIFYQGREIKYKVSEIKIVNADEVQYLNTSTEEKILTLQTCYPPGTSLKRLIVIAKQNTI